MSSRGPSLNASFASGPTPSPGADRVATRLIIHGRVQGVYYRNWTVAEALSLGLDGWVRNREDGTVEAVLAGPAEAVALLTSRCHQGPPAARVSAIDSHPADDPGPSGFHKLPTV